MYVECRFPPQRRTWIHANEACFELSVFTVQIILKITQGCKAESHRNFFLLNAKMSWDLPYRVQLLRNKMKLVWNFHYVYPTQHPKIYLKKLKYCEKSFHRRPVLLRGLIVDACLHETIDRSFKFKGILHAYLLRNMLKKEYSRISINVFNV